VYKGKKRSCSRLNGIFTYVEEPVNHPDVFQIRFLQIWVTLLSLPKVKSYRLSGGEVTVYNQLNCVALWIQLG
jgi:hypothetical protein